MSSRQQALLSDPAIRTQFFDELATSNPTMELVKNYAVVNFDSWTQFLSISGDCFYILLTEIVDLQTVLTDYELSADSMDSDEFDDAMNDIMSSFAYNVIPKGLLLDTDDNKPLYLDYKGSHSPEYHIVGDKILLRVVSYYWLSGSAYNTLLEAVDLTQFICRRYDTKDKDPKVTHKTDCDVITHTRNGEIDYIEPKIDLKLLKSWMTFQLMKQVFPVTFDPFFERDGLIHQKYNGYNVLGPQYKLPSELIDFNRTVANLQLSRRYHDSEWF